MKSDPQQWWPTAQAIAQGDDVSRLPPFATVTATLYDPDLGALVELTAPNGERILVADDGPNPPRR